MTTIHLDTGWTYAPDVPAAVEIAVTLPHDAMIHERRDRHVPSGPASGYYPGRAYTYRRTISAPAEWDGHHIQLLFEGAYRRSTITLNGVVVGGRPSGSAELRVDVTEHLELDAENLLEVRVDNSPQQDTRWYSGSGLYRRVHLIIAGPVRFPDDGVRFRTVSVGARARTEVEVSLVNDEADIELDAELRRGGEIAAQATIADAPRDGQHAVISLDVPDALLWSAETPHLYELVVRARRGSEVLAEHRERVGIRTIAADPRHGLRINDHTVLLRGGCVHSDSGVLGSATFRDAEFRRARILKEVGFNAIRAGHTPLSRDLLDACDEIGLYVMDELTDVWFRPKSEQDSARDFHAWWRRDLTSMIAKDRNHASVILYSIGNENGETATNEGISTGRAMSAFCHELDPTRLVTAGINPFLNALASFGVGLLNAGDAIDADASPAATPTAAAAPPRSVEDASKLASSTLINHLMNLLNDRILNRPRLPRFDTSTKGIFSTLDVAGYNYGVGQYELHAKRYPGRVMVGTETNPKDIVRNWNLVEEQPYLIGDFMWTAWDYLGEAGIGSWTYDAERVGLIKPWPWLTADCGAVDLSGNITAAGLLAGAAWGRLEPAITSRPPARVGAKKVGTNWRGTDAVPSWSWSGYEGRETEVEVYSAAPFVELFVNGRSLGRRAAGRDHGCTAKYPIVFEPGELVAVAYDRGVEVGRSIMRSATGVIRLELAADRSAIVAGEQSLLFVRARLVGENGVTAPLDGVALTADVKGAATLAGFGSADPKPRTGFVSGFSETFRGEALAVLRSGSDAGNATLTVTADGFGRATLPVTVH